MTKKIDKTRFYKKNIKKVTKELMEGNGILTATLLEHIKDIENSISIHSINYIKQKYNLTDGNLCDILGITNPTLRKLKKGMGTRQLNLAFHYLRVYLAKEEVGFTNV